MSCLLTRQIVSCKNTKLDFVLKLRDTSRNRANPVGDHSLNALQLPGLTLMSIALMALKLLKKSGSKSTCTFAELELSTGCYESSEILPFGPPRHTEGGLG